MSYFFHIVIMFNVWALLGFSLNLIVGFSGLISLCHAGFFGLGAYLTSLLMTECGINFIFAILIAMSIASLTSIFVALLSLRVKGPFFLLGSISVQFFLFSLFYNLRSITGGSNGISGIPSPSFCAIHLATLPSLSLLTTFFTIVIALIFRVLIASPFVRTLKCIREDELAASLLGKNILKFRMLSFMIAGGIAALAGGLYATYSSFISPVSFNMEVSISILTVVIIGGSGASYKGPLIGSAFMVCLPELLRFVGLPDILASNMKRMIFALLLIILMKYRPQGLAGEYKFE